MTKILVVEDQLDIANLIKINIEMIGLYADVCTTGTDGLKQFNNQNYDLITLDINLPDMDGIELCKTIREKTKIFQF